MAQLMLCRMTPVLMSRFMLDLRQVTEPCNEDLSVGQVHFLAENIDHRVRTTSAGSNLPRGFV